jgi:hypothetical protein
MAAPTRYTDRASDAGAPAPEAPRPAEVPTTRQTSDRNVAPDGQRVVDQRGTVSEDREIIEEMADRQAEQARYERTLEPSTRFWSSPRAMTGPILALLAGVFTLAIRTWPIATPQGRGTVGTAWFLVATLAGALYIAGFFLSDRHWNRARLVLVCAAVMHLVVGGLAALVVNEQQIAPALSSFLFDAVPAVVALIAAALISAPPARVPVRDR